MALKHEISVENLKVLEIKKIALNTAKFGALTFGKAYPLLNEVRKFLVEFDELGFTERLSPEEIGNINSAKDRLIAFIEKIETADPETADPEIDTNFNKNIRDELESQIEGFHNNFIKESRDGLVYLRQEVGLKSRDEKELKLLQKETIQTKQEFDKLKEQLEEQLKDLSEKKKAIAIEKGEIAAEIFGKHFEKSADEYKKKAEKGWYELGRKFLIALLILVTLNVLGYFILFIGNKMWEWEMEPADFFTLQYGLVKLALFLLISYVIGFASRQYSINSHLTASNIHRKNIAETMKDFYASDLGDKEKSIMIKKATDAMFQNLPIGHISKSENRSDDGPIQNIFSNIPNIKK